MNLGFIKWPLIIALIAGAGFLVSNPGINFLIQKFTQATPGQNSVQDKRDEAGLSRIAGFLFYQFRYGRCLEILDLALSRYGPSGANYWFKKYRKAKCLEKLRRYQECYNVLNELIAANADALDKRVPSTQALKLRAATLKGVHDLNETGGR